MNFKGHVIGGTISGILLTFLLSFFGIVANIFVVLFWSFLGSIFPDVDTASKSRKIIYFIFLCGVIFCLYIQNYIAASLIGILAILPAISKHRGWTHSILSCIIIPMIFVYPLSFMGFSSLFLSICYISMVCGYFSHLLLDTKF